ncbi:unnamed protein product, partial [Ectocarpus sp. 12 AP-2014]
MAKLTLLDVANLPDDHPALVPDLWARAMLTHPDVSPALRAGALEAVGHPPVLPAQGELHLTQNHEIVILEHLTNALQDRAFGARAGIWHDPLQRTILTYMMFSAETLQDIVTLVQRYLPITRRSSIMRPVRMGRSLRVDFDYALSPLSVHPEFGDFILGATLKTIRTVVGPEFSVDWVAVSDPSRHKPGVLEEIYGCPTRRDLDCFAAQIPNETLDLPIKTADAGLLQHLMSYGDIL